MSMFVCHACTVYKFNGDCSGTNWSEPRAEEIAENLKDYEIYTDEDPHFVMDHCSGCGERGGDMYRARYYDELD